MTIHEAAARAFWASTWADEEEREGRSLGGCEIMDVSPETPATFRAESDAWLARYEAGAGMLADEIRERHFPGLSDTDFGHYAAMEAMGHGVGLWEYTDAPYPKPPDAEPYGWMP